VYSCFWSFESHKKLFVMESFGSFKRYILNIRSSRQEEFASSFLWTKVWKMILYDLLSLLWQICSAWSRQWRCGSWTASIWSCARCRRRLPSWWAATLRYAAWKLSWPTSRRRLMEGAGWNVDGRTKLKMAACCWNLRILKVCWNCIVFI